MKKRKTNVRWSSFKFDWDKAYSWIAGVGILLCVALMYFSWTAGEELSKKLAPISSLALALVGLAISLAVHRATQRSASRAALSSVLVQIRPDMVCTIKNMGTDTLEFLSVMSWVDDVDRWMVNEPLQLMLRGEKKAEPSTHLEGSSLDQQGEVVLPLHSGTKAPYIELVECRYVYIKLQYRIKGITATKQFLFCRTQDPTIFGMIFDRDGKLIHDLSNKEKREALSKHKVLWPNNAYYLALSRNAEEPMKGADVITRYNKPQKKKSK